MNIQRVHNLIRYILAEARQNEEWAFRELGPIHLIKYMYLADMYYATENDGKTYTDIDWQFYHFGPWNLELYKEIPEAVKIIGADTRTFESLYAKDGVRYSFKNDLYDNSSTEVPLQICFLLNRDIRKFGSATNDLLHYVYTTPPMTNAMPGERLTFGHIITLSRKSADTASSSDLTTREKKKRMQHILEMREKIAKRCEENKKNQITPSPPRYDEVFFHGAMELDREFECPPLNNQRGVLHVTKEAWFGNWRKDNDLP